MDIVKIEAYGENTYLGCDRREPSNPVLADYDMGNGWENTPYQAAHVQKEDAFVGLAIELTARGFEMPLDEFDVEEFDYEYEIGTDDPLDLDWGDATEIDYVSKFHSNPDGQGLIPADTGVIQTKEEDLFGRTWYRAVASDEASGIFREEEPTLDKKEAVELAEELAESWDERKGEVELLEWAEEIAKSEFWVVEMDGEDVLEIAEKCTEHYLGNHIITNTGWTDWHTGDSYLQAPQHEWFNCSAKHDIKDNALEEMQKCIQKCVEAKKEEEEAYKW